MQLEGRVYKYGKVWLVEVPALDLMTQGKTRNDACTMLEDAVELLVGRKNFQVSVRKAKRNGEIYLSANNQDFLIALLLRRQRQKYGYTLHEMATRLGSTSTNAFARYEQGRSCPTISKFLELLSAVNPEISPVLRLAA